MHVNSLQPVAEVDMCMCRNVSIWSPKVILHAGLYFCVIEKLLSMRVCACACVSVGEWVCVCLECVRFLLASAFCTFLS